MPISATSVPAAGAPPAPGDGEPLHLSWREPRGLVGLSFVNLALRVLTLGIYHFWGKTEVRRRIWSAIRLNGEPLEYTGTGPELFKGFLVVFGVVLLPMLLGSLALVLLVGPNSPLLGVYQTLLYVGFFFLTGVGVYRAQRYRLNRTRWRGIRGGLHDASWSYGWTYLWTGALIPVTLGWIVPWRATLLQSLVTNRMSFGSEPLTFSASSKPLYGRFAGLWVGTGLILFAVSAVIGGVGGYMAQTGQIGPGRPPSAAFVVAVLAVLALGYLLYAIASAWYRAGQINHFAAHTHLAGATFRGNATAPSLIYLSVTNFLIVLTGAIVGVLAALLVLGAAGGLAGSFLAAPGPGGPPFAGALSVAPVVLILAAFAGFGLFVPIAQARSARYLVERLTLEGPVPLDRIAQGADAGITRGEGLAQAFDIDAF